MPLTEWLGPSPWSERMIEILDSMWKHAPIETKYGNIVSTNVEADKGYTVLVGDKRREVKGKALAQGLPIHLRAGESLRVRVSSGRQPTPSVQPLMPPPQARQ